MIFLSYEEFCFYTLHLTLPVKLEVCSPKTLPSTTTSNGNSGPPLTGPSAASLAVCGSLPHYSQLSSPQVSKTPPVPVVLPTFWLLLLGPFSGLTSLLSVLQFSTPGLLPWPLLTLQGILAPSTHASRLDFLMQSEKDVV